MKTPETPQTQGKTKVVALAIGLLILIIVLAAAFWPKAKDDLTGTTYRVQKRNMDITVLEGGSLISHGSLEIKSQVEGNATIISLVPDGTMLTEKDVEDGKIIVQLDASDLTDRLTQQEISVQSSSANYTQAREQFEIQKNQNESDIKAGELNVKFARMDLEKELGRDLATKVLQGEIDLATISNPDADYETLTANLAKIGLGGSALKELRKLQADIDLAAEDLSRAESDVTFSRELESKGYITRSELEADELLVKRQQVSQEQAKLALQLYLEYELPKNAEKLLSDSVEAGKELERIHAKARAETAKAEANLRSNEVQYENQKDRLEKLEQQVEACTIRAPKAGMVVYASTGRGRWSTPIEEGAQIRERQHMVSISGPRDMAVEVKVHESAVRKVRPGLPVRIVPDALKDITLMGRVKSVSVLPDNSNNWLNPDLKVYNTIIELDEDPNDVKPGMSTQVEIMVNSLKGVLAVPIQAVTTVGGRRVCYVAENGAAVLRPVKTGESNEKYIEILEGLAEGEEVLLHPPTITEEKVDEVNDAGEDVTNPEESSAPPQDREPMPQTPDQSAQPQPEENDQAAASTGTLIPEAAEALKKAPENMRAQIEQRLKSMSADEQREMLKRMSEHMGSGGTPGAGNGRPREERMPN